jgi:cytochrome c oxidase cbb3-type subunit III
VKALMNKKTYHYNNIAMKKITITISLIALNAITMLSQANPKVVEAAQLEAPSVYQSPVFYALIFVAVVLLIFIVQLGKVLSAIAIKYGQEQAKKNWDGFKTIALLIALSAIGIDTQAQLKMPEPHTQAMFLHEGFGHTAINALVVIIAIELAVVLYYMMLIRSYTNKHLANVAPAKRRSYFWDRMNKSVAIEAEAAIMTDHNYDGIRELDNALPPWWKYGFYLTIVWAGIYLAYYHVVNEGALQGTEYATEMEEARLAIAAYKAKAADSVDETTITLSADPAIIQQGASHYAKLCKVCHGSSGEGLVGPNLTDSYWLHGGDIKDVFKTVKYGIQGKGMKSWQQELSASEIAQVANYIMSLQGTNPANGKAPEGELYGATVVANPDTTAKDTLNTTTK